MPIAGSTEHVRLHSSGARGFTLIELTVVMGVITILLGLVLALVSLLRSTAQNAKCVYNLSQIGNAFRLYAADNMTFPPPTTKGSWEAFLSNVDPGYLGNNKDIFRCPADMIVYSATVPSSYDWRDTGDPATTIAGMAITNSNRSSYALAYEVLPGNHSKNRVNVVRADGSTSSMDQDLWMEDLDKPLRAGTGSTTSTGSGGGVLNQH